MSRQLRRSDESFPDLERGLVSLEEALDQPHQSSNLDAQSSLQAIHDGLDHIDHQDDERPLLDTDGLGELAGEQIIAASVDTRPEDWVNTPHMQRPCMKTTPSQDSMSKTVQFASAAQFKSINELDAPATPCPQGYTPTKAEAPGPSRSETLDDLLQRLSPTRGKSRRRKTDSSSRPSSLPPFPDFREDVPEAAIPSQPTVSTDSEQVERMYMSQELPFFCEWEPDWGNDRAKACDESQNGGTNGHHTGRQAMA